MKKLFADTSYWVALLNPRDELHEKAKQVSMVTGPVFTVTSEMVLTELLNIFAEKGEPLRKAAAIMAERLKSSPNCEVVPQTSLQFRNALDRYQSRLDKGWSLTDCASHLIMEEERIREGLTYDEHFIQAGFRALLRDAPSI
jgi:predicted nucleic acid-binding protein